MIDRGELLRKLALNVARFSLLGPIAGGFYRGVGAILMLHRVTEATGEVIGANRHLTVSPHFLDALLAEVGRLGYRFVTMDEAVDRLASRASGEPFVTVTADDAYRDNVQEALPVLEKHEAPITIYVAPALIEGRALLWWDVLERIVSCRDTVYLSTASGKVALDCSTPAGKLNANNAIHDYLTREVPEEHQRAVIRDLALAAGVDPEGPNRETLMNWDEIRAAAAHPLVTIGSHTVHHYNLRRLDEDKARREIVDAGGILEIELGARPRHMAYPYGYVSAVGAREVALAREAGYASAVTTRHGMVQTEHARHLHSLPRISINGRYQRVAHVRTMLSGITTPIANRGRRVVTL
ncbi:polysaccharide deacetylase family protein [Nitratireductor alexandrii]|uniref:polysaccharide deacetylase family protein n=1 Tax=Nitratireductor alexandrii TaxID=2448161 RepID=UPI000FDB0BF9|nr:polysaccharide deacetylase family protein [Nitratireductor alexandrii]